MEGTRSETSMQKQEAAKIPMPDRTYKDRIFRMIFKEKKEFLELYNAINNTAYTDPEELVVTTLENAIYMGMKNDVSFLLHDRLSLYEHQSTDNPNMPLRNLLYVAEIYSGLTCGEDLYRSHPLQLPEPRFVEFYNGEKKMPEYSERRLSDLYPASVDDPALELKVQVLNINNGCNPELMKKCQTLREYMFFVSKIREYRRVMPLAEAMERTVTECIEENILADFLKKNRAEVIKVGIFEYDEEFHIQQERADAKEEGRAEGKAEDVLELLEELGNLPVGLRKRIMGEQNLDILKIWLKRAARSETVEQFQQMMY